MASDWIFVVEVIHAAWEVVEGKSFEVAQSVIQRNGKGSQHEFVINVSLCLVGLVFQ